MVRRKDKATAAPPPQLQQQTGLGSRAFALAVGLVVAAACVATIWGEPRPIGDLFAGLAVGQDVVDGKLGKTDDWAFTTEGRVCYNQNWGTHLAQYLAYRAGGDDGLLVLKAGILVATCLFLVLAARQRGVSWGLALIVAGGAIAGGRSYIDLRANLTTLMLAPLVLWLFFKTRKNVHWIWPVMLINLVWANSHGGFIFGLGMMALWVGVFCTQRTLELLIEHKWSSSALKLAAARLWPLPAALVGSVALAAFANPYGPRNLTLPLTILDPAWQKLNEWQPLIASTPFGTTWEFIVTMSILAALLLLRLTGIPGIPASAPKRPTLGSAAIGAFDVILAAVVINMTFRARRFVPLSIIVVAPMVAVQLQWLLNSLGLSRRQWAVAIPGAALLVPVLLHGYELTRFYASDNPRHRNETIFGRMHGRDYQPVKLAEFVLANNISGRVFNEWRWEGYLHWKCPQLKLFIGGRAHQVYDSQIDWLNTLVLADPQKSRANPTAILSQHEVHMAIVNAGIDRYTALIRTLVENPHGTWAYVYYDGTDILLADTTWPETRELVRRAAAGELKYPDPATAALSRAMALISPAVKCPPDMALDAFLSAVALQPSFPAYSGIRQLAGLKNDGGQWLRDYFQQEYARLEGMNIQAAGGIDLIGCQITIASVLARSFAGAGDRQQQARWQQLADRDAAEANQIVKDWP